MGLLKRILEINYKLKNKDREFYKKLGVKIIGEDVSILNSNLDENFPYLITIGEHVTITNSTILTHDATSIRISGYTKVGKVSIGNNVFIGYNSLVMPGSEIGDNVIIGAGSIVRGQVPDGVVMAGNPLKYICSYDEYAKKTNERIEERCFDATANYEERNQLQEYLDNVRYSYSK